MNIQQWNTLLTAYEERREYIGIDANKNYVSMNSSSPTSGVKKITLEEILTVSAAFRCTSEAQEKDRQRLAFALEQIAKNLQLKHYMGIAGGLRKIFHVLLNGILWKGFQSTVDKAYNIAQVIYPNPFLITTTTIPHPEPPRSPSIEVLDNWNPSYLDYYFQVMEEASIRDGDTASNIQPVNSDKSWREKSWFKTSLVVTGFVSGAAPEFDISKIISEFDNGKKIANKILKIHKHFIHIQSLGYEIREEYRKCYILGRKKLRDWYNTVHFFNTLKPDSKLAQYFKDNKIDYPEVEFEDLRKIGELLNFEHSMKQIGNTKSVETPYQALCEMATPFTQYKPVCAECQHQWENSINTWIEQLHEAEGITTHQIYSNLETIIALSNKPKGLIHLELQLVLHEKKLKKNPSIFNKVDPSYSTWRKGLAPGNTFKFTLTDDTEKTVSLQNELGYKPDDERNTHRVFKTDLPGYVFVAGPNQIQLALRNLEVQSSKDSSWKEPYPIMSYIIGENGTALIQEGTSFSDNYQWNTKDGKLSPNDIKVADAFINLIWAIIKNHEVFKMPKLEQFYIIDGILKSTKGLEKRDTFDWDAIEQLIRDIAKGNFDVYSYIVGKAIYPYGIEKDVATTYPKIYTYARNFIRTVEKVVNEPLEEYTGLDSKAIIEKIRPKIIAQLEVGAQKPEINDKEIERFSLLFKNILKLKQDCLKDLKAYSQKDIEPLIRSVLVKQYKETRSLSMFWDEQELKKKICEEIKKELDSGSLKKPAIVHK